MANTPKQNRKIKIIQMIQKAFGNSIITRRMERENRKIDFKKSK